MNSPTSIEHVQRTPVRQVDPESIASALLHERFDGIDLELEIHIEDLDWQWRTSYDRFQRYGRWEDRQEALLRLHEMNAAILSRSPAVQAARHAEFECQLTEQVAYFMSEAALELGRIGPS